MAGIKGGFLLSSMVPKITTPSTPNKTTPSKATTPNKTTTPSKTTTPGKTTNPTTTSQSAPAKSTDSGANPKTTGGGTSRSNVSALSSVVSAVKGVTTSTNDEEETTEVNVSKKVADKVKKILQENGYCKHYKEKDIYSGKLHCEKSGKNSTENSKFCKAEYEYSIE